MWPPHKNSFLTAYAIGLKLLSPVSLVRIAGTSSIFFSIATAIAPVIGFFLKPSSSFFVYGLRTALSFSTTLALGSFFFHIPTLAGTLVLSSRSRLLTCSIAVACMVSFLVHPIGKESYIYSLYWLIPIVISFIPAPSIFLRSLSSTFITHAVGSAIFLYTHATTSIYWQTLFPQVLLERLALALFLTASYYVVTVSINLINQRRFESAHV